MKKEIIETAKTVEEAINSGCLKLGCEREDCEWEIIDLPKKGFLGLRNFPAKVRVCIEVPDQKPVRPPIKQPPAPPQAEKPAAEKRPKSKPAVPRTERTPHKIQAEKKPWAAAAPAELAGELLDKANAAREYLAAVLARMGIHPTLTIVPEETGVNITVQGEGLGAIIGRRGETLDSLQYLAGLAANRLPGEYLRVTVDCGDYRLKRKETLEALARRLSAQVLKTNVSKTLEPMNPFERRIIHAAVTEIEGVTSLSVGDEPNRRVVITSPTARSPRSGKPRTGPGPRPRGTGSADRSRGPSRRSPGGSRRGPRERSAPIAPAEPPANPPTEASDKPLYSKIDLE